MSWFMDWFFWFSIWCILWWSFLELRGIHRTLKRRGR